MDAVHPFPDFDVDQFLSDRAISLLSGCSRAHSLPRAHHRAKLRRKYCIVYQLRAGGHIPSVAASISKLLSHMGAHMGAKHFHRLWVIVSEEFHRYSAHTRDALIHFLYSPPCRTLRTVAHDPRREPSPGVNYYWTGGKWTPFTPLDTELLGITVNRNVHGGGGVAQC